MTKLWIQVAQKLSLVIIDNQTNECYLEHCNVSSNMKKK